jgi:CIC family chloride channel protein
MASAVVTSERRADLGRVVRRLRTRTPDRERIRALGRRSNEVLLLAAVVGATTGLAVAGFEQITRDGLLEVVIEAPTAVQLLVPGIGLTLCTIVLAIGRATPSTSDEYIRGFHAAEGLGRLGAAPARLLASVATLGSGAPLGYEGPALYAGATVGELVQRRAGRFAPRDRKVLLVAGAAAGVAAIFKAPVTGLVFALEVPYEDDLARRMVLPASISAAASYVTFAALVGTEPILPIRGQPPFDLVDLGGAAAVGLACGLLARIFILLITLAKRLSTRRPVWLRVAVAGAALAAGTAVAEALDSGHLVLGPGYDALDWALDPKHSLWLIAAIGTLRVLGTAATVGGGGAGGLFIPLVIQGAFVGRCVGGMLDVSSPALMPVVGMAAFLGAGYRVPLAAVVFVAEFTGRPGFVIPGLVAAVVAQLAVGRRSVSAYQAVAREGHLERRLQLPAREVMDRAPQVVSPQDRVDVVFWEHLVANRQHTAVVCEEGKLRGLVSTTAFHAVPTTEWPRTTIDDLELVDRPTVDSSASLEDVLYELEHSDVDRVPVVEDGAVVGVITRGLIVALSELADATDDAHPS